MPCLKINFHILQQNIIPYTTKILYQLLMKKQSEDGM